MPNVFSKSVNAVLVGNPLRAEIDANVNNKADENYENRNVEQENNAHVLNVLIVGGSQGAQVLNTVVPDAVKQLNFAIKLVHQSGLSMYESVKDRYASHSKNTHDVEVKKFINNMMKAYRSADIVVCRSGAMTVSELSLIHI